MYGELAADGVWDGGLCADDAFADTGRDDSHFVPRSPCAFAIGAGRDHDSWLYGTDPSSFRKRRLVVGGTFRLAAVEAAQVAAVYPDEGAAVAAMNRIETAVHGCAAANTIVEDADQLRWHCSDFAAPPQDQYGRANNGCVAEVRRVGSTLIEARAALPDRDEKYVIEMAGRMAGKVGSVQPRAVAAKAAYSRLATAVKHCPTGDKGVTVTTDLPARLQWHDQAVEPGSNPAEVWELRRVGTTVLEVHTQEFGTDLADKAIQQLADRAK